MTPPRLQRTSVSSERSWGWTAYAACGWGIAYAVFARWYQPAGGTIGLPGTFEDPDAFRRASLLAGILIFVVGLGALAFVRPWGPRIPRWLLIVPALAGSVYAMAHALTAYMILVTAAALHHHRRTGGSRGLGARCCSPPSRGRSR